MTLSLDGGTVVAFGDDGGDDVFVGESLAARDVVPVEVLPRTDNIKHTHTYIFPQSSHSCTFPIDAA